MPSYGISLVDLATPILRRLRLSLDRAEYKPAVGLAGARAISDHLAAKENDTISHKTADRLGAPITHLYAGMARSTNYRESSTGVIVSINHIAARQRYFGGKIEPVNTNHLAIAAIAEAYGRRPREAGTELAPMFICRAGQPKVIALGDDIQHSKSGRTYATWEFSDIWYWLVESVTQQPDPTVLPDEETLIETCIEALQNWAEPLRR